MLGVGVGVGVGVVGRRARRVVGVEHGKNVQAVCNVTNKNKPKKKKEIKASERFKPKV